jgi:DNA-binding NarL/FixJ family response regulator
LIAETGRTESTAPLSILMRMTNEVVRRGRADAARGRAGWSVCAEAATGREAVDAARRLRPDVAILDIGMEELNGLEAARQIRKMLPSARS